MDELINEVMTSLSKKALGPDKQGSEALAQEIATLVGGTVRPTPGQAGGNPAFDVLVEGVPKFMVGAGLKFRRVYLRKEMNTPEVAKLLTEKGLTLNAREAIHNPGAISYNGPLSGKTASEYESFDSVAAKHPGMSLGVFQGDASTYDTVEVRDPNNSHKLVKSYSVKHDPANIGKAKKTSAVVAPPVPTKNPSGTDAIDPATNQPVEPTIGEKNPSGTTKQAADPRLDGPMAQYAKSKGIKFLADTDDGSSGGGGYTHLTGFYDFNSCDAEVFIGADPYNAPAILLTDSESGAKVVVWQLYQLEAAIAKVKAQYNQIGNDPAMVEAMEAEVDASDDFEAGGKGEWEKSMRDKAGPVT
jgi:hypothetical protein